MPTFDIAGLITFIGTILTGLLGWFGDVIDFVTGNPLTLFLVVMPIAAGLVPALISLIKRIRKGKKA